MEKDTADSKMPTVLTAIDKGLSEPFSKKYKEDELDKLMNKVDSLLTALETMVDMKDSHETLGQKIAKGTGLAASIALQASG